MNTYRKLSLLVICTIISTESLAMQKSLRPLFHRNKQAFVGAFATRQHARHMSVLDWLAWSEASDASDAAKKALKRTDKIASDLEKIIDNQVVLHQQLTAMEKNIALLLAKQSDTSDSHTKDVA